MAPVVCVHGIGKQLEGEEGLLGPWRSALRDGMRRVNRGAADQVRDTDVAFAFFGDLYRPRMPRLGAGEAYYRAADVDEGLETELLTSWWHEARQHDLRAEEPALARTPHTVQAILRMLCRSQFFGRLALRALIFDLKQVSQYFAEPALRAEIQGRLANVIEPDTRVVVAHSLGSIVAYEVLAARPELSVRTLVTLGSPLGTTPLFQRLVPAPGTDGLGIWPGDIETWANVADEKDVVALEKRLSPLFGPVEDLLVNNGVHAHDVRPYLRAVETGTVLVRSLA